MRKQNFKLTLSIIVLYSMITVATANAAPVQFNQVVQIINAKPGKANTGGFAQLRLGGDDKPALIGDDETKKNPSPQDSRVITETRSEIVEDDVCDCVAPTAVGGGFPYGWLALGAVPLIFLIPNNSTEPNNFVEPSQTPTPTPTPTTTPTMTPVPTPEPMTIFLFGTGLAGIGLAARKKFGKKDKPTAV